MQEACYAVPSYVLTVLQLMVQGGVTYKGHQYDVGVKLSGTADTTLLLVKDFEEVRSETSLRSSGWVSWIRQRDRYRLCMALTVAAEAQRLVSLPSVPNTGR